MNAPGTSPDGADVSAPTESTEEALRRTGDRIGGLLEELKGSSGPGTWQGIEELLERTLHLYGAALAKVLQVVRESGQEEVERRLLDDELLSSLFLLHGLHELPPEARIRQAIEQMRPRLASQVRGLRLVELSQDGVAIIGLAHEEKSEARNRAGIEAMIRSVIEEAAPELLQVRIADDLAGLVQLRTR